ncbi:MAG: HD domain-containing protein [Bacillota bacterium]|uniref:Bifunctional (P)ppGpp synthetase/guanosine-3',5'-bis(Diphosphate) 3'-pyrophosphohydrolase n=1 Tax=Virgibacillus salarius TaxID=447199 RepID=A0A941DUF8_9BACI|nr:MULTISPECIES: HD domain-containing protein [Bacillaceae]NAZ09595.1 HD domain-containing protein [Agaribacter marinus]MBR7796885.1 bifunctional (p)ppGpp synthetase/guanosine-3',5'-bis(diphosphate) 3'-pyrophosphohydrolase [Virgibacillus salarius]MCC2250649.1 HD domain-containing protein [Virgibacillus sp. AGTR]MDY7046226.1 HD domain-containing protein [Virgibacillus sp. M23]QRZ19562.1 bifunctional (p)ppGpp synthetase/guanosine-3',5'-bis(diphosphate) 3'-pyrophosphohydrolase [Virgibacillus sp. 
MRQKAKAFATKAHDGQRRKSSNDPYITHPIRVAARLAAAGFRDELISAGYLHDVAEDTSYTIKDIKEQFGDSIAHLVAANTENKSLSWQERKQHTIDNLKSAEKEIKYLIIADKLDNLLSLEQDLRGQGAIVWDHFNAPFEKQKWYNQSLVEVMYYGLRSEEIPNYFRLYEETVARVFEGK